MFSTLTTKLIAIGIVVAITIAGWMYVTGLQDKVAQLEQEKAVLVVKVKDQNDAILSIEENAKLRAKAAAKDLEAAAKIAEKAKADAQAYYRAKPSTPADRCKSALDLINGGVK